MRPDSAGLPKHKGVGFAAKNRLGLQSPAVPLYRANSEIIIKQECPMSKLKGGPVPASAAMKILAGVKKHRLPDPGSQVPLLLECPDPPKSLEPAAKKHWQELAPLLHQMGLAQGDLGALSLLCELLVRAAECTRHIKKDGLVTWSANSNQHQRNPFWII